MAYTLSESASGASTPTAKNRVWGNFEISNRTRPANRRKPSELRRKNRLTPTKTASGIPYWPSRDPIAERGGINLYGFVMNNSLSYFDILGQMLTESANNNVVQTKSNSLPDDIPAGTIPPDYPIKSEIKIKGDVATLLVQGSLPTLNILVNQNMDQASFDRVIDEFGDTVGEHELEHVRLWVQYWNALRAQLSGLDGDYCPAKCATIAFEAAQEIRDIFHAEAQIQNTSYDLLAYPKLIDNTKGERQRLNNKILAQDNIVKGAK